MAEIGISLAGKLIEVVGSEVIKEMCSVWGYKSELDDLKETIITIRTVLLDAESKDQLSLSQEAQHYIHNLQDAVYDADDLFDEFLTRANLKQHNKDGKLSEKVRNFFSTKKAAYSMSLGVKKLRKQLGAITSNHNTFGFSVDSQPIRERREDTCSYVYSDEVVGREDDLNKVVHMLLDSTLQDNVSFLSIVGIGGLGKTTLAQLVFNDPRVTAEFPLRLWTCVSDENGEEFKVKEILHKIISASDNKLDALTMDSIHRKIVSVLGGKKYLIVLDDVWNEDLEKWLNLKKFLMSGGGGSRVLVTTRSERTAMVVNEEQEHKYELKGLSPEYSWRLFEMTAFGVKDRQDVNYAELIKLGEKIVKQCCNVPLAIKVVGTLLYGQNESKWRLFHECGVAKLKHGDNKIMSILKLSYDNLESPLKTCFSYCALFPKDFVINKEKLIRLWMAQGYIVPLDVGQSLEDAGEEYISILIRRCFFHDVEKDKYGGVQSFKIHDLFHDVAQKVAGKGVVVVSSVKTNTGDEAHHLFHVGSKCKGSIFPKCKIRSYVRDGFDINFQVAKLVENWKFLRTLDLHDLNIESLPNSIGKLLHLRYLDLSDNNRLVALPDSVTKLYNLQTLDLCRCFNLKELPKDLAKLVNLRHLDLLYCDMLSHMPSDLAKLSCLSVLTQFVVGEGYYFGELEKLLALKNLRGSIRIQVTGKLLGDMESSEGYMRSMKHLEVLDIAFSEHGNHEILLEKLEPPSSLKGLILAYYDETNLPRWWGVGIEDNLAVFLPNLVQIDLGLFLNLLRLPSFSKLLYLKSLNLYGMDKLEYIEDSSYNGNSTDLFFPSLEELCIFQMKELKGWWRRDDIHSCNDWQPSFSKLSVLEILDCRKLTLFPACLNLEKLTLCEVNKELRIRSSDNMDEVSIKLKEVTLEDLDYLKSLPTDGLISISIHYEIESLSELSETFKGCVSLRSLVIGDCYKLRSLEGAMWEHLTALDSLELSYISNPTLLETKKDDDGDDNDDDDDDVNTGGMPWRSIGGRLRSLVLKGLKMKTIPQEMRHLSSLENLLIECCEYLTALPEWISYLCSLRTLRLKYCGNLQLDPVMVGGLTSLQLLEVSDCRLVPKTFQDTYCEELRHIPFVDIRPC